MQACRSLASALAIERLAVGSRGLRPLAGDRMHVTLEQVAGGQLGLPRLGLAGELQGELPVVALERQLGLRFLGGEMPAGKGLINRLAAESLLSPSAQATASSSPPARSAENQEMTDMPTTSTIIWMKSVQATARASP